MTERASSTNSAGKYRSTRYRHSSTSRAPPSTGGTVVVVVPTVVVVVAGGAVVVVAGGGVVVVVAGGAVVVVAGGGVVVVVAGGAVVVVAGVGSALGAGAGSTGASTTSCCRRSDGSISGFSTAENPAAATRADKEDGRTFTLASTTSSVGSTALTAAKPSAAMRITINDPAAEI